MININAFSKEHPNGARNRSCIKSPELLKRIDTLLLYKEIPAKELDALEQTIRCTNQCFVPQWLLADLYDTTGVSVKVEKPAPKAAPIKEPIKAPVVDNDDSKGTGEPGLGIEDPTLTPGVGHPADEGTGEPSGEPAPEPIEPVGEGIPDGEPAPTDMEPANEETTEPTGEPAPADMEPANEETTEPTGEPAPTDMEPTNEEAPAEEPAPAEDTTEAPAETEQPKAKRGRKKADAAE